MNAPFGYSADTLFSFFSQAGRGFYVPYYQRNYSWDEQNAEKLVLDIAGGVKRVTKKPDNSVFLGTVILHDEKQVTTGIHVDSTNLITKVDNVVDGQQRIASLSLLACTLSFMIDEYSSHLKNLGSALSEYRDLAVELENQKPDLQEMLGIEIKKHDVQPRVKPIIIRAGDASSNPISDQWTLKGNTADFYRSNVAKFISDFIDGVNFSSIETDERIRSVIDTFTSKINEQLAAVDAQLIDDFLAEISNPDSSLHNFM